MHKRGSPSGVTQVVDVYCVVLFILTSRVFCSVDFKARGPEEYLLCGQCGSGVGDTSYVDNIISPLALSHANQTLFGDKVLDVQIVKNPLGIKFRLVILSKADCIGVDEWHSEHSWFPGYLWKFCLCSHCGQHLGWIFEPESTATANRNFPSIQGFYALIADNILSESYADSLLIIPKSFKS